MFSAVRCWGGGIKAGEANTLNKLFRKAKDYWITIIGSQIQRGPATSQFLHNSLSCSWQFKLSVNFCSISMNDIYVYNRYTVLGIVLFFSQVIKSKRNEEKSADA